jgi:hypothetical protein
MIDRGVGGFWVAAVKVEVPEAAAAGQSAGAAAAADDDMNMDVDMDKAAEGAASAVGAEGEEKVDLTDNPEGKAPGDQEVDIIESRDECLEQLDLEKRDPWRRQLQTETRPAIVRQRMWAKWEEALRHEPTHCSLHKNKEMAHMGTLRGWCEHPRWPHLNR